MSRLPRAAVVAALVCLPVLVVRPPAVHAQASVGLVWEQLSAVSTEVTKDGYASTKYLIGQLKAGESESWSITLTAGQTFLIAGACDASCTDIDLVLTDAKGEELDSDLEPDDAPVLVHEVRTTGTYTVKVSMYACGQDPCFFGIGVFRK